MPQTSIERLFDKRRGKSKYPSGIMQDELAEKLCISPRTLRNKERIDFKYWQSWMKDEYIKLTGISEKDKIGGNNIPT